jgi:hypothetical protein
VGADREARDAQASPRQKECGDLEDAWRNLEVRTTALAVRIYCIYVRTTIYMTDYNVHYSQPHRNMSGEEKKPYQTRASELAVAYKDAMQRYVERHLAARAAEETKYANMRAGI